MKRRDALFGFPAVLLGTLNASVLAQTAAKPKAKLSEAQLLELIN